MNVEKLVDEDHCVRAIWELVGRLDLRRYHEQIAAVEGSAGREHTDPRLLISLWLYAYGRGISSARELARQCEYEPGCQWLCGLQPVSHRTLSGFRSENKAGLDDLFAQVLGMLSAEGLISLERVTLDGTKIKANASGNTFRRQEKIAAHLEAAREQVRVLNDGRSYWRNADEPWARSQIKDLSHVFGRWKASKDKVVIIRIDRDAKFSNMVDIIDELDLASLTRFSLQTLADNEKQEVETL